MNNKNKPIRGIRFTNGKFFLSTVAALIAASLLAGCNVKDKDKPKSENPEQIEEHVNVGKETLPFEINDDEGGSPVEVDGSGSDNDNNWTYDEETGTYKENTEINDEKKRNRKFCFG